MIGTDRVISVYLFEVVLASLDEGDGGKRDRLVTPIDDSYRDFSAVIHFRPLSDLRFRLADVCRIPAELWREQQSSLCSPIRSNLDRLRPGRMDAYSRGTRQRSDHRSDVVLTWWKAIEGVNAAGRDRPHLNGFGAPPARGR